MATKAEISTLQQQVADSSHILDHQGLVDFHGHVSARIPGTNSILIKPVLRAHNQIKAADIITVDMDEYMSANTSRWNPDQQKGRVIDAPVPPRETMLHVCAYQHRSDVHSVVHTHQLVATAIGAGGQSIKPLYNQALPFAPETPIYPKANLITDLTLGNEVAETLGDRTALLLQGHGIMVVGESVDHAVSNTIYLERTAIMQVIAAIVGTPQALDPEYVASFAADWNRRAPHAYEYFRSLVPSLNGG